MNINVWTNFAQLLGPNSTAASSKRYLLHKFEQFYTIDILIETSCFECFSTIHILNVLTPQISCKHLVLVLMLILQPFCQLWPTVKRKLKSSVAFLWPGKGIIYCETQLLTDQKLSSSIFACCLFVRPHR